MRISAGRHHAAPAVAVRETKARETKATAAPPVDNPSERGCPPAEPVALIASIARGDFKMQPHAADYTGLFPRSHPLLPCASRHKPHEWSTGSKQKTDREQPGRYRHQDSRSLEAAPRRLRVPPERLPTTEPASAPADCAAFSGPAERRHDAAGDNIAGTPAAIQPPPAMRQPPTQFRQTRSIRCRPAHWR